MPPANDLPHFTLWISQEPAAFQAFLALALRERGLDFLDNGGLIAVREIAPFPALRSGHGSLEGFHLRMS